MPRTVAAFAWAYHDSLKKKLANRRIIETKTDGLCIHFPQAMFHLIDCIFTRLIASSLLTQLLDLGFHSSAVSRW